MNTVTNSFRKAVVKKLAEIEMSHSVLAFKLDCAETTLYKFLVGETKNVPLERAYEMSKILGIPLIQE